MEIMTQERRRKVKRLLVGHRGAENLRIESLMNHLQEEVRQVREEQPELQDYQLYDLTFSFQQNGLLLQMEFRR
jgi:hypothetical protein